MSLLTAIILVPLLTALGLVFVPRNLRFGVRLIALASSALTLLLAFVLFVRYDFAPAVDGFKFVQQISWVESLGISYFVGVDGINLGLVVMGALVAFAAACCSWEIKHHEKEFYILLMVMTGGILGAFASLDLFFFYFFHELALVPTFIMIGVWGRGERKNYATFQITLYLSVGALLALAGLIALYLQSGANTFNLIELTAHVKEQPLSGAAQQFIFPLLLFGFGILVSLWPFHTWAPLGYGSAPTATAMLHAGVLKKFGLYGLLRVAVPLLPEGAKEWAHVLLVLLVLNILYIGLVTIAQKRLDTMLGYSSVMHMGYVFLGIAAGNVVGLSGAAMLMLGHGLSIAALFAMSGHLRQSSATLAFTDFGGIAKRAPFLGYAFGMAAFASIGLPGFVNFASEIMVFFGAFGSAPQPGTLNFSAIQIAVICGLWGVVISAVYMLRAFRKIFMGDDTGTAVVADPKCELRWAVLLLLVALLIGGVWPKSYLSFIQPSVEALIGK